MPTFQQILLEFDYKGPIYNESSATTIIHLNSNNNTVIQLYTFVNIT